MKAVESMLSSTREFSEVSTLLMYVSLQKDWFNFGGQEFSVQLHLRYSLGEWMHGDAARVLPAHDHPL